MRLEHFAESAVILVVDVARELLAQMSPGEAFAIKSLTTEQLLLELRKAKVINTARWEVLDELREGRNSLQHGASFVPWRALWGQIELVEVNIDGTIDDLQAAFARVGVALDIDFPELSGQLTSRFEQLGRTRQGRRFQECRDDLSQRHRRNPSATSCRRHRRRAESRSASEIARVPAAAGELPIQPIATHAGRAQRVTS